MITKAKNPNVIMVRGSPKILNIGLTIILRTPKTIAKIRAVEKLSKCTPGKILVNRNATIAVIKSRMIKFIIINFLMFIGATEQKPFHLK